MNITNNDILIRLRYALDIKDSDMVEIFKLGGVDITRDEVLMLLKKPEEDSDGFEDFLCTDYMLESFLNGLIVFKRGKQEPKPGQPSGPDMALQNGGHANNVMLKKVKIALSLTSDDIIEILKLAGVNISKGELSALLRKEGHKNYKECGDRYARNFLKGLAIKYRG
jgi:uncharacterized protein YehS (DUF1456 family)